MRPELGRFAFNDAKRGPVTAELVADPSAADQIDVLHVAAFHNQVKTIQTLLSIEANAKITNVHGLTPLHLTSDRLCLRIFLNACGNKFINTQDHYGNTPLLIAITNNRSNEYIKELIKWRADVNIPNAGGFTPLYCATAADNTDIMTALIFAGAELDTKNHTLDTAPLHIAAMKEDSTCLQLLIKAGADVDLPGVDDNFTPLHIAALYDTSQNAQILLDEGANHAIKSTIRQSTPLDLALEYNNFQSANIISLAIQHRASYYQEPSSDGSAKISVIPQLEGQEDVLIRPQKKRFNKPRKSVIKNVVPAYRLPQITTFKKAKRLKKVEHAS